MATSALEALRLLWISRGSNSGTNSPATPSTPTTPTSIADVANGAINPLTDPSAALTNVSLGEPSQELGNWDKYCALMAENTKEKPRTFIIPARRVCNFGVTNSLNTIRLAKRTAFITDDEIIKVHPLQFLRNSPFMSESFKEYIDQYSKNELKSLFDDLINKELHAIAITENGKHVILQQAVKSCVPTCIGMLALDHGKPVNYEAIKIINLANQDDAIRWTKEAGLTPKITMLFTEINHEAILTQCLKENGPGMLAIDHPILGGHAIIVDSMSRDTNTANIRDPFHGWALTIRLDDLLSWKPHYFLQIEEPLPS